MAPARRFARGHGDECVGCLNGVGWDRKGVICTWNGQVECVIPDTTEKTNLRNLCRARNMIWMRPEVQRLIHRHRNPPPSVHFRLPLATQTPDQRSRRRDHTTVNVRTRGHRDSITMNGWLADCFQLQMGYTDLMTCEYCARWNESRQGHFHFIPCIIFVDKSNQMWPNRCGLD